MELPSGSDLLRAWLFVPEGADTPQPCVVMGHGFGLTRRCGLREFAAAYAEAGYVVLLFDYRGFGDSGGKPRQLVSFRRQVEDWRAAVAFARRRAEVDPSRVATWGFSLGAGHALTTASYDPRIAAVVAVTPMFDGVSSTLAAMRHWSPVIFARILLRAFRDVLASAFGWAPVTVPVAAPPGELGLLTSPGAYAGYRAIGPDDFDFSLAARIALFFWTYLPGWRLSRLLSPILVFPSTVDQVNPPRPTLRRTKRCPRATIVELACPHMSFAEEPHRTQILEASLEFLRTNLASREVH